MEILQYSEDFYQRFCDDYYEKKPVVIRGCPGMPFVSEEQALHALRSGYSDAAQKSRPSKIYKGGRIIKNAIESYLPSSDETTIEGFFDRLETEGQNDLCFALFTPHRYLPEVFKKSFDWVDPILARTGMPSRGIDSEIFAGNYAQTPFDVHLDPAGTLSMVLSGAKKMLVWPYEVFEHKTHHKPGKNILLEGLDYRPYLDQAIVLEGQPGDLLYWPSYYWHVGVGNGRPVSTYNLSFYIHMNPTEFLRRTLLHALGSNEKIYSYRTDELQVTRLPEALAHATDLLVQSLDLLSLNDQAKIQWAKLKSLRGFFQAHEHDEPDSFERHCRYALRGDYPSNSFPLSGEVLGLAFRGEVMLSMQHATIFALLQALKNPEGFVLEMFLRDEGIEDRDADEDRMALVQHLEQIMTWFYSNGALRQL